MNRDREQLLHVQTRDPRDHDTALVKWPGQLGNRGVFNVTVTDPATGTTQQADVEFQYVKGDSSMTVSPFPGAVMFWSDRSLKLVTTAATNRGAVAGVCPANKGKGNHFFIMTGGLAPVKYVDSPAAAPSAAGLFVFGSATAGKAEVTAAGTASTYPTLGRTAGARNPLTSEGLVDLDVAEIG